jgi:outer membrane protein OmpA-like peptidoglycan-associated protein
MAKIFTSKGEDGKHWISISDMMSGLMMVFLFIAISYMINVTKEKDKIKEIAVTYNRLQNDLHDDLFSEFKDSLESWSASIDRQTLSVRFESPEVLFSGGSYQLQDKFKVILNDFFPRYINILSNDKYKNDIDEIRIEGHTSSDWTTKCSPEIAYFNNMNLSQNRTRSVLEYVLTLPNLDGDKDWIRKNLTANGLSSSKLILNPNGDEDKFLSRRVEFRVKTNAEKRIVKIINETE